MAEVTAYLQQRFGDDGTVATNPGRLAVNGPTSRSVVNVHAPREYTARLEFGGWRRRMSVTVEVTPWSNDECELLVRPGRRPPVPGNAYYAAAIAVVDALAAEVSFAAATSVEATDTAPLRRAS
jgi:hypothetical protein